MAFKQLARRFGLDAGDLGREFTDDNGCRFQIVGLRRKARKSPIIVRSLDTGEEYVMGARHVQEGLAREHVSAGNSGGTK